MDPRIAQLVHEATTIVIDALAAGNEHAAHDCRLKIDPVPANQPGNYKGTWVVELDLLGLYLPKSDADCRFNLVIHPGEGKLNSSSYVVTQEGELRVARFAHGRLILDSVDDKTTTWLVNHVHQAMTA